MKRVIVLGCILLLVFSSALLVGFGSGGGGGDDEAQAKAVAEKFMKASMEYDIEGILDTLSEKDKKEISDEDIEEAKKQSEAAGGVDLGIDYKIGKVEIEGDKATVEVAVEFAGEKSTDNIYMLKEDGKWKVDGEKSGAETEME
ncbi:MAG: DUF4878 domain-containing protein [Actinobacteria bacterium]|nr:DUF4878 domain-containing protein [Actinomycetota bacterium]